MINVCHSVTHLSGANNNKNIGSVWICHSVGSRVFLKFEVFFIYWIQGRRNPPPPPKKKKKKKKSTPKKCHFFLSKKCPFKVKHAPSC